MSSRTRTALSVVGSGSAWTNTGLEEVNEVTPMLRSAERGSVAARSHVAPTDNAAFVACRQVGRCHCCAGGGDRPQKGKSRPRPGLTLRPLRPRVAQPGRDGRPAPRPLTRLLGGIGM